jgi:hypothetical protein
MLAPYRSLGVVAMRRRSAEYRKDRVADELFDRAAVTLDLFQHRSVIPTQKIAHVLGIRLIGSSRGADDIDEERRYELAFLASRCGPDELRTAIGAEPRKLRIFVPAPKAGHMREFSRPTLGLFLDLRTAVDELGVPSGEIRTRLTVRPQPTSLISNSTARWEHV